MFKGSEFAEMKMSWRCFVLLAAGFGGLQACAVNAVTGRWQLVAMTEREEVELGNKIYRELQGQPGLVEAGRVADYVSSLGAEMAVVMQGPAYRYRFSVVDSPVANAFALPGGHVLVTRGLLALCNGESELVGVLGHELGHVVARHASARAVATMPLDVLAATIATAVEVFDAREAQRIRDRLPLVLAAPYGRDQEREADRVGVLLAASLGYDSAGLGRILGRMAAARGADHANLSARVTGVKKSGIATHPPTDERIAIVDILAKTLEQGPPQAFARDRAAFLGILDGLSLGPPTNDAMMANETLLFPNQRIALDLPGGWIFQAAQQGYVAVAPGGEAVLSVESESPPRESDAATQLMDGDAVLGEPMLTRGGVTVHRVRQEDAVGAGVTSLYWFNVGGRGYRLVGTWQADADERFQKIADETAGSIRMASTDELGPLGVLRLRVIEAVDGEKVSALGQRSRSAWTAVEIANANGIAPNQSLTGGQLVKVAVCEGITDTGSDVELVCRR